MPNNNRGINSMWTPEKVQKVINHWTVDQGRRESPVTGQILYDLAMKHNYPLDILLAQGAAESQFGIDGRGVATKNIFNVGNTNGGDGFSAYDKSKAKYNKFQPSWEAGIEDHITQMQRTYLPEDGDWTKLITNFVDNKGRRYATDELYESKLKNVINSVYKAAGIPQEQRYINIINPGNYSDKTSDSSYGFIDPKDLGIEYDIPVMAQDNTSVDNYISRIQPALDDLWERTIEAGKDVNLDQYKDIPEPEVDDALWERTMEQVNSVNLPGNQRTRKMAGGGPLSINIGNSTIYGVDNMEDYRTAYNENRVLNYNKDGQLEKTLDPVTIVADRKTGKQYPYYDQLTKEEQKYFNNNGSIGSYVRGKAELGKSPVPYTQGIGQILAGYGNFAAELTGIPGAIRFVKDPVQNLKNTRSFLGKTLVKGSPYTGSSPYGNINLNTQVQYTPEEIESFINTLDVAGIASIASAPLKAPVQAGLRQAGRYATTQTPLRNAYKYNPWAFKPNPEALYRGVGDSGIKDAIESGIIRQNPNSQFKGEDLFATPYFKLADEMYAGNTVRANQSKRKNIIEIPKSIADFSITDKLGLHARINNQIPTDKVNLLTEDWLRGYKPIEVPRQLPGSPNAGRGVKSGNVDLRLWNIFNKKKPEPFLTPSLNAEAELARANADALAFSQSPYNKAKLQKFRPGQDFNVTNTEALFPNDPLARERFAKLMKDDPDFLNYRNIENWQGADEGNYAARNFGDMDDLAIVNKNKPQSKIYNAGIHETGHSRSVRLPATKEERAILDDAWGGLKESDGSSLPVLEAEAVQGELRMLLGDKLGKRVYTKADEGEIKTALEKMIANNHPYIQNINDFDISKIIKSLNKIGLASVVGIGAAGAAGANQLKFKQGKGEIKAYQRGGLLPKAQDGEELFLGDNTIYGVNNVEDYRTAYNEGRVLNYNKDGQLDAGELPEIMIGSKGTNYPNYGKLTTEEKKLLNNKGNSPIKRAIEAKALYGKSLTANQIKGVTQGFISNPLIGGAQAPQSAMVEGIEALRGKPYDFRNILFPSTQRIPSETWGVENPVGAFAVDILADPELIGGLVGGIGRAAVRKTAGNLGTKKMQLNKVDEHFLGISRGLKDKRPFSEKFPLTKEQKIAANRKQDKALKEGMDYVKQWFYGDGKQLHPVILEKMQRMAPSARNQFLLEDITSLSHVDNPFNTTKNLLVSTRSGDLKTEPISDFSKHYIKNKRGEILGVNLGNSTDESITLRNIGLYSIPPERIKATVVHEGGHTSQKLGRGEISLGDGRTFKLPAPFDNINTWDLDFTGYGYANPNTPEGKFFKDVMVEPQPHKRNKAGKITKRGYTWAASVGELHSELMVARLKLLSIPSAKKDPKAAMDILRSDPTDDMIDWMIITQDLDRFFKKSATLENRREAIRRLYSGAGLVGTGTAAYKSIDTQDQSQKTKMEKGGPLGLVGPLGLAMTALNSVGSSGIKNNTPISYGEGKNNSYYYSAKYPDKLSYKEPEQITKTKNFQKENNIPPTGFAGEKTIHTHMANRGIDGKKLKNDPNYSPEYTSVDYQNLQKSVKAWEDNVVKVLNDAKESGEFSPGQETIDNYKNQIENKDQKLAYCISGVCRNLLNADPTSLEGGKNRFEDIYFSNTAFEENAEAMGWSPPYKGKNAVENVNIGDVFQIIYPDKSRHALIVKGTDEYGNIITAHNGGGTKYKEKTLSPAAMLNRYNMNGSKLQRFSRYQFTGEDGETYNKRDYMRGTTPYIDEYVKSRKEFTIDPNKIDALDGKSERMENWIKETLPKKRHKKAFEFYEGISDEFGGNVSEQDAQNLVDIGMAIMFHESGYGDNDTQRLRAKKNAGVLARLYRTTGVSGEKQPFNQALSGGLSQIDPKWIDTDIRNKFFPEYLENTDKNNRKITRRLFRDKELAGKVSQDLLIRRYNNLRNNPNLYGNDPKLFWYALAATWQNPNAASKAYDPEEHGPSNIYKKGDKFLPNFDLFYSDEVFKYVPTDVK